MNEPRSERVNEPHVPVLQSGTHAPVFDAGTVTFIGTAMRAVRRLGAALLFAWGAAVFAQDTAPATIRACVEARAGTHPLHLEVARTPADQRHGLMEREHLAADAGMLFVYDTPQPAHGAFWMYRTRIPLDIAFLDGEGRILVIRHMQPCASDLSWECPRYVADVPYHAALEVNSGWFAAHGVGVGDRLRREAECEQRPAQAS